jgi:poly-beta-1,6-N-acetyl-D-glucosamine N-deacetylase
MKTDGTKAPGRWILAAATLLLAGTVQGCTGNAAVKGHVPAPSQPRGPSTATFQVLSYHDVRDDITNDLDPDRYAVSTERLVEHIEWLLESGHTLVSLDDLLMAERGGAPLPPGAVLLTIDDGLRSVYTRVFPILQLYQAPAIVAVVGSWLDAPPGWTLEYDGIGTLTRDDFVSWDELREMKASGLVEVATHTYDLHRGVLANPFGNEQPAAVTRIYDPKSESYEAEEPHRARIRNDLKRASRRLEEELGAPPRAVVWPFGAYSGVAEEIADELGLSISFSLLAKPRALDPSASAGTGFKGTPRYLVTANSSVQDFSWFLRRYVSEKPPVRVVHVDLDYMYDPDPVQMERNLDVLLDRIQALGPTTVYLQAFADPEGDGTTAELYFPNRHLPVRADIFNRVAWQLKTRVDVEVFAWMPLLAFELPDQARNDVLSVKRWERLRAVPSRPDYRRLSPYMPEARRIIHEIYEDLGRAAAFDGILFHDDAYLNDREDASAFPNEPGRLPTAREKTLALLDLTHEVAEIVRRHRPEIRTARNLYARVVLEPRSEEWFAQNFELSLELYDQTAVMAMPYLEGARNPERWLDELVRKVAQTPGGLEGTVFEFQAVDWRVPEPVPAERLAGWMRRLERQGAIHFGYYPDDFIRGVPELESVRRVLSVERYPWPGR